MIKYLPVIIFLFLLLGKPSFSQTLTITGKVVEKQSREALMSATVALYQKSDSSLVIGTISDSEGIFTLAPLVKGNYFLEISFLGFIPYYLRDISLIKDIDLGTVILESTKIFLDEVSIKAEKSILVNQLDKKVYNVAEDILAESSSASEILQNIPSVSVDINGEITLRNTANITFFINGKPSAMLRRNASAVLAQMPANSIERIEIITNPSAKYRPDGVGGIINIVLKKKTGQGFSGQIAANIGNENRYNANLNLNYGTENLKLFGNYGIKHSAGKYLYSDERYYKSAESGLINNDYNESGNSKINALSHTLFVGGNYEINDFNTIEMSGTYFHQNSMHKGFSEIYAKDSLGLPDYSFTDNQTNDEFEQEAEASLTYEHQFKNNEDHTLTFESTYSAFNEEEDLSFKQVYTVPDNFTEISNLLVQKSGNQTELNVDYTLPVGEDAEFESGYAGEFVFEDIRYTDNGDASRFLFNQEIHALYGLYGQSFEDFSFKVGLRAEQTLISSHLKEPTNSLINNNYFKLFPTIHLGYDISDDRQISLSYSKRINRPDSDELNPNPEFSDPRNAEAGNPELQPEQIHSLELGYQSRGKTLTLTSALYYRYKYDAFTSILSNIGDSIVLSTIENLNTRQSSGIEVALSGKIKERWNFDISGDVYYTMIDATRLGYSENKSSISGNLKAYSLLKFAKTTFLQFNAFYYFPRITPQGNRKDIFYINGGLKQNLFKNKASVTFTATDIFHTYKVKYNIESKDLDQNTSIQRKQSVVYLGFIWRFNNYKEKDKLDFESEGLMK